METKQTDETRSRSSLRAAIILIAASWYATTGEMCAYRKRLKTAMLSMAIAMGGVPDLLAGCRINYSFHNNSERAVKIYYMDVMSRGGIWRNILRDWNMGPGTAFQDIYRAAFSCKAKRRYRFVITDDWQIGSHGGCKSFYYPSAAEWTRSTDIDFGDLSRYCK